MGFFQRPAPEMPWTTPEVIRACGDLVKKHEWQVKVIPGPYSGQYQVRLMAPKTVDCFCPVTAVCFVEKGLYFGLNWYSWAADRLNFPLDSDYMVSVADDLRGFPGITDTQRATYKHDRLALLAEVGLVNTETWFASGGQRVVLPVSS